MKPPRSVPISYVLPDWLRAPVLPIFVGTEIRAIIPAWLLALVLIAVAPLLEEGVALSDITLGTIAYSLGCVTLGSIAAGHDFMHRTFGMILSLPVSRERLWWTRLAVALAGMTLLAILAGVQLYFHRPPSIPPGDMTWALAMFLLPVLSGVLVAPWLTLLCRSPLAGTVFTLAMPFLLLTLSELLATAHFGLDSGSPDEIQLFKNGAFKLLLLAHWVAGGVFGRARFMRQEAIEGRVGARHLPRWLNRQRPAKSVALSHSRSNPVWQLVKKELRLQTMAFATLCLFLFSGFLLWTVHQFRSGLDAACFELPTFLYVGFIAVLMGSVASAEERQLGTAEWQGLLPMAARMQWAVKVIVVLCLVVLFAALLPAFLLQRVSWGNEFKAVHPPLAILFAGFATALATMCLYVSSLCNSGLKAMLASLSTGVGLFTCLSFAWRSYAALEYRLNPRHTYFAQNYPDWLVIGLPLVLIAGLFVLMLGFGFTNHRSAERGAIRIWRQVGCLIAYGVSGAAVLYQLYSF